MGRGAGKIQLSEEGVFIKQEKVSIFSEKLRAPHPGHRVQGEHTMPGIFTVKNIMRQRMLI